ncbi:MAG: transcriptional regulator [Gallionellales bacterium RIFCSPLOWO2_02_58_13]|nr:MAG: transcriptional regulator [Gallionellales bacterium RIFCSPLOWO2_02_58_13]
MNEILQYLKTNGEQLDTDIAKATGIPLAKTHLYLAELATQRQIMVCHSIRFEGGKKIEGISCRLTGFIPKEKTGAKPKT